MIQWGNPIYDMKTPICNHEQFVVKAFKCNFRRLEADKQTPFPWFTSPCFMVKSNPIDFPPEFHHSIPLPMFHGYLVESVNNQIPYQSMVTFQSSIFWDFPS